MWISNYQYLDPTSHPTLYLDNSSRPSSLVWWEYHQYYISMFGESINSITSPCLVRVLTVFLPRFVFWASSAVCYIEMGPGILWLDGPLRRHNVILVYKRDEYTSLTIHISHLHTHTIIRIQRRKNRKSRIVCFSVTICNIITIFQGEA